MANYRTSRILPTILVIIVIIIAIVALVSLARALFFSTSTPADTAQVDASRAALLSTAPESSVRMTVRGPIVAEENFRSYQLTVSANAREIQTFRGYLDTIIEQQTLGNNTAAYAEFVHALELANFTKGTQFADEKNDVRGICATGRVYEFRILKNNEPVEMLWTSTCQGSAGSLKASADQLTNLFTNQIPDASRMIRSLSL